MALRPVPGLRRRRRSWHQDAMPAGHKRPAAEPAYHLHAEQRLAGTGRRDDVGAQLAALAIRFECQKREMPIAAPGPGEGQRDARLDGK